MTGPDGETVPRLVARDRGRAAARRSSSPTASPTATATPNARTCRRPTVRVRLAEQDGATRMELRFTFESGEHMERLERWGAFDVFPLSVGQMDAVVAGTA